MATKLKQTRIFSQFLLKMRGFEWQGFPAVQPPFSSSLILLLIVSTSRSTLALLGVLSLHATRTATTVWRAQGEVNVLLAVQPHHKGWDVHHLLAHTEGRDEDM